MRAMYLTFEFALMIGFFWAADWNFRLVHTAPTSDYGTIIGGLIFLAFGALIALMLFNEASLVIRDRFGVEINPVRLIMARLPKPAPETEE